MLSNRFIVVFFLGAVLLAWIIPSSWITGGHIASPLLDSPLSPWSSNISLDDVAWGNGSPHVRVSIGAVDAPLSISGWSIENERGERVELGAGVKKFIPGETPSPLPMAVASNTSLLISFGPSPLGVSFQEHFCSGYLRGTTPLSPPIEAQCPILSNNPKWGALDSTCKNLIESLPRCTVISPEHLGEMTPACELFLRTVPTYASCVREVGDNALLPRWRIFVGEHTTFIRQEGGVVILRDDRGMVVDTLPYERIGIQ
jgi:hypothetical protein